MTDLHVKRNLEVLECQVQIITKAFVHVVIMKPNKMTYACYTDFHFRDSKVNTTFKFLTCDQNQDALFEQLNNPNFDNFVWVLKSKM